LGCSTEQLSDSQVRTPSLGKTQRISTK